MIFLWRTMVLMHSTKFKQIVPPISLILLDINMPIMGGLKFLEIIKTDEKYKRIPVIVLTLLKKRMNLRVWN